MLNRIRRFCCAVFRADALRCRLCGIPVIGIGKQTRQHLLSTLATISSVRKNFCHPEPSNPFGIVVLVVRKWNHQHRAACAHGLSRGADAPLMNNCCGSREKRAMWHVAGRERGRR